MGVLFLASVLLSPEPFAQTTSPSGKIVYVKLGDIWVMDADGTNQTNLTPDTPDTNEGQPAWSPDGAKIAFTGPGELNEDGSGGLDDIYVMDADPSTQSQFGADLQGHGDEWGTGLGRQRARPEPEHSRQPEQELEVHGPVA